MRTFMKTVYKAAKEEFDDHARQRQQQQQPYQQQGNLPYQSYGAPSTPHLQYQYPPGIYPGSSAYSPPPVPSFAAPSLLSTTPQHSLPSSPFSNPTSPLNSTQQTALQPVGLPTPLAASSQSLIHRKPTPSGASCQTYLAPQSVQKPLLSPPIASAGRSPSTSNGSNPQAAMQIPDLQDKAPVIGKILSLDGGGIRGLSELLILQHIMKRLRKIRGVPTLEPWQEFDMIGGTSTGGLLAIMLGRLRMSLDECQDAYLKLSEEIFTPVHSRGNGPARALRFLNAEGRFDAAPLEDNIKKILVSKSLPEGELLHEQGTTDGCKVFVCAVRRENAATVTMRSYDTEENDHISSIVAIWEAARATSAASTFFPPIRIGPFRQEFADGAIRHNNPIDLAEFESSQIWPDDDRMIISIGTGSGPGPSLAGNLKDLAIAVTKIATDTEDRSNMFQKNHQNMVAGGRFFRFNVYHGLADIDLAEYKAVPQIATHTDTYLDSSEVSRKARECVKILGTSKQRLDWVGGEDLVMHLEKLAFSDVFCNVCNHCCRGISYNTVNDFYCPECSAHVCSMCLTVHQDSHSTKMIRIEHVRVQNRIKGIEAKSSCQHCAQERACRIQCKKCEDHSICFGCFDEEERQRTFFEQHSAVNPTHRAYTLIYPEHWYVEPPATYCPCTSTPGSMIHCQECFKVCCTNSSVYLCRTCYHDTGASCYICEACWFKDEAHRKVHEFVRVDLLFDGSMVDNNVEAFKSMIRCPQCPGQFLKLNSIAYHPHPAVQFHLNAALLEAFTILFFRTCTLKRVPYLETKQKEDAMVTTGKSSAKCTLCENLLPFDIDKEICLTSGCVACFCKPCSTMMGKERPPHRHPTYNCSFKLPLNGVWDFKRPSGVPQKVDLSQHKCDLCGGKGSAGNISFRGIMCFSCLDYDICFTCLIKMVKGEIQVAEGFPHRGHSLLGGNCKAMGWLFWRTDG